MTKPIVKKASECQLVPMECGTLTWFASRQLGNSGTMTVGRSVILPGRRNPLHFHPNCDEVLHVLHGTILHTLDGETVELAQGDTVSIPANVVHNAQNTGTEDAILLICFSSAERETVWV